MSKYKNKRCVVGDKVFDSYAEGRRYTYLLLLQKAGKISNLRMQVPFVLIPEQREISKEVYKRGPRKGELKPGHVIEGAVKYIADFVYVRDGVTVVEDVKGRRTKDYIIKRKLMLYIHKIKISEVSA